MTTGGGHIGGWVDFLLKMTIVYDHMEAWRPFSSATYIVSKLHPKCVIFRGDDEACEFIIRQIPLELREVKKLSISKERRSDRLPLCVGILNRILSEAHRTTNMRAKIM